MIKTREQVKKEDRWNVELLYPNIKAWEKDFQKAKGKDATPRWSDIAKHRGTLQQGPKAVLLALRTLQDRGRWLEKLFTYAHLRNDEDIANDDHKAAFKRISNVLHDFSKETAWFEPELLALPKKKIDELLKSPLLKDYRFHLQKIIRRKDHTLSQDQEELLAMSDRALQGSHKAFSALNDADFKFGKVKDDKGVEHELTHGTYGLFIRSQDRTLRRNSFQAMLQHYGDFEQTLCELISGQVERHLFQARARRFQSCLDAALFQNNIDTAVYHSLIKAVRNNIDALHDYMKLRKQLLGLKELHLYDAYVPITKHVDMRIPYREGESLVIEAAASLGPEYQKALAKGLQQQRWVDRYENRNKRSGAYSSGCFDSQPYILMNYKDLVRDVSTLAHEGGHSMHSYLSHKHQPYHYSHYPIFVAEVASTFNEQFLFDLLLQRAKNDDERIFLINEKLEEIRGTLFRQTMFAEFELAIHATAEKGIPLTPALLKQMFAELNAFYFGKNVVIDNEIQWEWARIPHFYYNFYVYQYATGISAAIALSQKVKKDGNKARDAYLTFLSSGCSQFPIDLLQLAGVNMRSPQPVEQAIDRFRELTKMLRKLSK